MLRQMIQAWASTPAIVQIEKHIYILEPCTPSRAFFRSVIRLSVVVVLAAVVCQILFSIYYEAASDHA